MLSALYAAMETTLPYLCSSNMYKASIALMVRRCSCYYYHHTCALGDVRFAFVWGSLFGGELARLTRPCMARALVE